MKRGSIAGTVAALGTAGALLAMNARDHAQDPPTDIADVVATVAVVLGAAAWFALRWADEQKPISGLVRAVMIGVVIGAVVIGMASVVYDPWAN